MRYLLLSCLFVGSAFADQYLIDEMEALKASLEKNDPGRQELSLRLADLYFDVSIQEGDEAEKLDKISHRKKSLELYLNVLNGRDGLTKVEGEKEILIKYQTARVYRKLGQQDDSKSYFEEVFYSDSKDKNLKREAAYSLAEYYEEKINFDQSDKYYKEAISLCSSIESCNLSHYKRAWLHYKELKVDSAIEELKLALFDRTGQVREKVINDLMLFFSNRTTDGKDEIAFIKELVKKTGKDELVRQLVESFYGAGNRVAGANSLIYLNTKSPDIFYEMRLLEEFYGFRDWDEIEKYLSALEKRHAKELPQKNEESKEFREMLKRVIVQFGSEADQDPKQYSSYLRRAIDRYLSFYPNDEMRTKLQQGWLKAQEDKTAKIERLGLWIKEDIAYKRDQKHIRQLRQTRLSLAQELAIPQIILEESLELALILKDSNESREFIYLAGLHYYKNNNFPFALSKFLPLAKIESLEKADKWAILAQNLTLDIYNQQKAFDKLAAQADTWLSLPKDELAASRLKELTPELNSMNEVKTQSQFEYFALKGETKESLQHFYENCFAGIYPEKSCPNAKVLAVKLADQTKLVSLLEKDKDEKALMVEYERMGRFSDAARLLEKYELKKDSDLTVYFKIAALYEIDQKFSERDRVLKKIIKNFKKPIDVNLEAALYKTLDEAGLIDEKSILLPWSVTKKIELANRFDNSNNSKSFVTAQDQYAGHLWIELALSKIEKDFNKFDRYKFYGRNSERKFKYKEKLLEKVVTTSNKYLEASTTQARVYILDILKRAYLNMGTEIMSTPLPEGLTDDIMMQVQANLTQLATPYLTVADKYSNLQEEQILALDEEKREKVRAQIEVERKSYAGLIEKKEYSVTNTASYDYSNLLESKQALLTNPTDLQALSAMEKFYLDNNNPRLAGYFKGRINQLKEIQ